MISQKLAKSIIIFIIRLHKELLSQPQRGINCHAHPLVWVWIVLPWCIYLSLVDVDHISLATTYQSLTCADISIMCKRHFCFLFSFLVWNIPLNLTWTLTRHMITQEAEVFRAIKRNSAQINCAGRKSAEYAIPFLFIFIYFFYVNCVCTYVNIISFIDVSARTCTEKSKCCDVVL